jgi:pimeloyl-ACP methyl ester carboxylesterase
MDYTTTHGLTLHYDLLGDPSKPTIIVLHGNGADLYQFNTLIDGLAPLYQVLTYDARDHGKSGPGKRKLTYDLLVDDLRDIMDFLNISKAHFFGYSDGGNVALKFAQSHPDRVLSALLYSPNPSFNDMVWYFRLGVEIVLLTPLKHVQRWRQIALMREDLNLDDTKLQAISAPICICMGEKDVVKTKGIKRLAQTLGNGQLTIIPKASHYWPLEHQTKVLERMRALIETTETR